MLILQIAGGILLALFVLAVLPQLLELLVAVLPFGLLLLLAFVFPDAAIWILSIGMLSFVAFLVVFKVRERQGETR